MAAPDHPLPTTRLVDVDGPVCVADYGGPEDGPLLVAVHGLGGSHLNWMAVAPALTQRSRLLAVDLVGHGRTPVAGRSADVAAHLRLLSGVLRTVADQPAVVVGNSMGGLVAALLAAEEPASVAGLVLVDPALPAGGPPGLVHPRVVVNFLVCAVAGSGRAFPRRPPSLDVGPPDREPDSSGVLRRPVPGAGRRGRRAGGPHGRLDRRQTDAAYLQSARSITSHMIRPAAAARYLQRFDCPVLLIHGERDLLVPLSVARRLHAAHPGWRLAVASGVGHVPMLEAPGWTAAVIDELAVGSRPGPGRHFLPAAHGWISSRSPDGEFAPQHQRDQLMAIAQLTWRSLPSQYGARSRNFWSLPVAVRGRASRNSTRFGHL